MSPPCLQALAGSPGKGFLLPVAMEFNKPVCAERLADACFPGNPREADHAQVIDLFRKVMA